MSDILFLKGESSYELLDLFLDEMKKALEQLGKRVDIVELGLESSSRDLSDSLSRGVQQIFSYNGLGLSLSADQIGMWDDAGVTFITSLVDHPSHNINRLSSPIKNLIVTCVDKNHVGYAQSIRNEENSCFFLPHFGLKSETPVIGNDERDIDILFPATLLDVSHLYNKWKELPESFVSLLDEVLEYVIGRDCIPLEEAISEVCVGDKAPYIGIFNKLFPDIDIYIRQKRREQCLTALAEAGIAVDIVGKCNADFEALSHHRRRPPVSLKDTLDLMSRAKVVLNVGPHFSNGSHERVFSAMLNGAVAITDKNHYWSDEFIEGEDLLFYEWTKLGRLPETIKSILADSKRQRAIAESGKGKAEKSHTSLQRAKSLLQLF